MNDISILEVRLHGRPIGTLTRLSGDRVLFAFNQDYISDQARPTLSLSFQTESGDLITDARPTQTRLPPFFANLLPEGAMREYLAARAGVKPERDFFLLAILGRDLPGALEIEPVDGTASTGRDAAATHSRGPTSSQTALRFSLAGVQLKFSAVMNAVGGLTIPADGVGGSWIVKLPSATFPQVPENEFAMMELARKVGISVPATALVPVAQISGLPAGIETLGTHIYTIRRFDRAADGRRVHIEDFAQVFGIYPQRKHERASYRTIAEVLWRQTGQTGLVEFVRRLMFNVLIGNGDMHLKNWSLIYPDARKASLAPAYDFVSTIAYIPHDRLALTVADSKHFSSITVEQLERFATKAGVPVKLVVDTTKDTVARFAEAWRNSADIPLEDQLRRSIEQHLDTLPLWNRGRA